MKPRSYNTPTAFRSALEDRLSTIARSENVDLQRIRRQVAFDRLLARIFREGNPPWLLKGAYSLELKLHSARTTKGIDLDRPLAEMRHGSPNLFWTPYRQRQGATWAISLSY